MPFFGSIFWGVYGLCPDRHTGDHFLWVPADEKRQVAIARPVELMLIMGTTSFSSTHEIYLCLSAKGNTLRHTGDWNFWNSAQCSQILAAREGKPFQFNLQSSMFRAALRPKHSCSCRADVSNCQNLR